MTQWTPPPGGQPQVPLVVTKAGGLSGTAHAVHILICVLTCGLWIPGYILFMIFAPAQRQEIITPYGQPLPYIPGVTQPAYGPMTPPQPADPGDDAQPGQTGSSTG